MGWSPLTPQELGDLDLPDLIALVSGVDHTLEALTKASTSQLTRREEKAMVKTITDGWEKAARDGTAQAVRISQGGTLNQARVDLILNTLDDLLEEPLTAPQKASLLKRLRQIWIKSKESAKDEIKAARGLSRLSVSFTRVDVDAIKAINRHQVFWIGDFYNAQLSERIRAVSQEILLEQGLGQRVAGRVLKETLQREFGLTPGGKTAFAPGVPARFAGNPQLYFENVAATAAHQSRTFGKMTAFSQAEVISYRLINPQDERTGQICQQMAGQVFSVQVGVRQMNRILEAQDPADVKEIAPWLSGTKIEESLDGAKTGSKDATQRLQEAGVILPPFHARCRTEPVVIG